MKTYVNLTRILPIGVATTTLALTVLLSPVALARQSGDDSGQAVSTGTPATETESNGGQNRSRTTATATDGSAAANDDSVRVESKSLLQTERQHGREHTTAQRQQACEAHKAELTKREANYVASAQRHLDTFNTIYTKVQAFQATKQLQVPSYDALVSTANTKQAAATAAVNELKTLDVSIDCTQTDPAGTVATLKTAVQKARSALQDYRASIKDVIVALKGASTDKTADKSFGGTQ